MPSETRNYVSAITGASVEQWAKAGKGGKQPERMPTSSCRELMALLKRAPNPFIAELEQRVTLAAAKGGACSSPPASAATRRSRCTRAP